AASEERQETQASISANFHKFTWQPHGSQFTIIEPVPEECLIIAVKKPPQLDQEAVLRSLGFEEDWISVTRRKSAHE
ncbi:MAG: hypothetical protein SNJ72_09320, partial [Fimbriimonadales bacterium]